MTTYLFLYTEAPSRRVLERARPPGRLILASDCLEPADGDVYDECVLLPSITRLEETLAELRRLRADVVVVQHEYALLPGTILAGERGFPALSAEAALLCTNKWLSRLALRAAGVPVPRFALVDSAAGVRHFSWRYPVVLKPMASTLARHVMRVDGPEAVDDAVGRLRERLPAAMDVQRLVAFARLTGMDLGGDPLRQFLVEEFADGEALEVDGLVSGGRVLTFGVVRQVPSTDPPFHFDGYVLPVPRPGIEAVSRRAVAALGLRDAGFSIEFRGPAVIEVNGRLGEDVGFPELFHAAFGAYPLVRWLAGDTRPVMPNGRHALAYANCYGGTVHRIEEDGLAEVLVKPGQVMHAPGHPAFNPHLAYALASHATDAEAAYRQARKAVGRLRFEIENPALEPAPA